MKNKITCLEKLEHILYELSDIRDELEYGSKLDKEAKSIEKKVEKFMEHLNEE